MNIAFWDNSLCERGTTVALYDYAHYNETILGNTSYIFYGSEASVNKDTVIQKFKNRFIVHGLKHFHEVDSFLERYGITHIYIIKSGERNDQLSKVAKNCIHAVFNYQPHGDKYASIAPWVNGTNGGPVVPHMINIPSHNRTMRAVLGIPTDAIVFGGYGGATSFSIPFVHKVVYEVAKENPTLFFLFANFNRFCPPLPNVIHLDTIVELEKKTEFINTCDAMLHARMDGETFGIAVGEFSSMNKPVITTRSGDSSHIEMLGSKGTIYTGPEELKKILVEFRVTEGDWNAYRDYTPEKVMAKFKDIFLS
jgi:hypothetical protein